MVDFKSLFAAVVGALVLTFAFSFITNDSLVDFGSLMKNPTGFSISSQISKLTETKTVRFTADLKAHSPQSIDLRASVPIQSIAIDFSAPSTPFLINKISMTSKDNKVYITNFTGRIYITDKVTIDGKALIVKINENTMSYEELLSIKTSNLTVRSISIEGLPENTMHLKDISGTVNVTDSGNRLSYELSKSPQLDISTFTGSINMAGGADFGIYGSGMLKSTTLQSPGN